MWGCNGMYVLNCVQKKDSITNGDKLDIGIVFLCYAWVYLIFQHEITIYAIFGKTNNGI